MLTCFKRPGNIKSIADAIAVQTVKPTQVWLYHNQNTDTPLTTVPSIVGRVITASKNMGVWPRFLTCMDMDTDYVCVFDDDTVPGSRWFENCLNSMEMHEGLHGTNGIIFPVKGRKPYKSIGWKGCRNQTTPVDIVGHSWFFKRDWLRYYGFMPRPSHNGGKNFQTCGEDYHFSVSLQMMCNLRTYVPPHPKGNKSVWGSVQGQLGRDHHALWKSKTEERKKNLVHNAYRQIGWRLINDVDKPGPRIYIPGGSQDWESVARTLATETE